MSNAPLSASVRQTACMAEVLRSEMLYTSQVALEEACDMYQNDAWAAEAADHYVEGRLPFEEFRLVINHAIDRQALN